MYSMLYIRIRKDMGNAHISYSTKLGEEGKKTIISYPCNILFIFWSPTHLKIPVLPLLLKVSNPRNKINDLS